jgi:hypothetical protein
MAAEKAGDLKLAAAFWEKVKGRFPDEAKLEYALEDDVLAKARWGWLAQNRLDEIARIEKLVSATRQTIENNRKYELAFPTDETTPEVVAIRAFRLAEFGDSEKAGREWDKVAALTEKEADKLAWYLLACHHRAGAEKAGDNTLEQRIARITMQLDEAAALTETLKTEKQPGTPIRIRILCREVIDLYNDENDEAIKKLVARARSIASAVPKS